MGIDTRPEKGAELEALNVALDPLRVEINAGDVAMVALLNIRARAAIEVAKVKIEHGQEVYQGAREEEVLARARASNANLGSLVLEGDLEEFFRKIMQTSRRAQQEFIDSGGTTDGGQEAP